MALKLNFLGSCSYYPLLESRTPWTGNSSAIKALRDFSSKSKHLWIASPASISFSTCVPRLLSNRNTPKRKQHANVLYPNTSMSSILDLLEAYEDEYHGVIIDPDCLPSSANAFVAALRASIFHWKQKGKKGIWLKILVGQADLVPVAIKEGFTYHHAEPRFVMLAYWIPEGPCMLPASASHQIGIGGFVMNDRREVLVVKERACPCRCSGVWKFPTGFINKSEELFSGVIREVKEETGIDTAFLEVVAFRHAHLMAFEQSDLLFICMLKPLTFEIAIDELEIEEAKWMPLDEFISQPFFQEDCMSKKAIDLCVARYENHYTGLTAHQLISNLDGNLSYLYYNDFKDIQE